MFPLFSVRSCASFVGCISPTLRSKGGKNCVVDRPVILQGCAEVGDINLFISLAYWVMSPAYVYAVGLRDFPVPRPVRASPGTHPAPGTVGTGGVSWE